METIPSKSHVIARAEQDLDRIKQLLKIIDTESCLLIYSYLMLFGRTTPARLRDVTGLSKATMFRNLALLYDAEILDKEEVPVSDKRYSLHYYISKHLPDEAKRLSSKRIQNYAIKTNKQPLLNTWILALETLPLTLNRITTELILKVSQSPSDAEPDDCIVITKMVAFRVGDIEDGRSLMNEIGNLVKTFDSQAGAEKRNWKLPLLKPATMTVSLVTMGGAIPEDADAVVASRIEC